MSDTDVLSRIVTANDVRGLAPEEFTPAVAKSFGAAFTDLAGSELVIGHDMRDSAEQLVPAFIEGARERGAHITHIGLCSTDGLYFASGDLDLPGVMFTASHNPAGYNGMKLCYSGARPIGRETGLPELTDRAREYLTGSFSGIEAGSMTRRDILPQYARYLRALVPVTPARRLKVVVDAGNGMAGMTTGAVLGTDAGLPDMGIDLVPMYFELDGSFPNHEPNPLDPDNLVDLQAAVIAHEADLGLAFDGDADRCFAIDEHGITIDPSAIITLVGLRETARELSAGRTPVVIRNLIASRSVEDLLTAAGATVITTRVGHAYIKEEMAIHDAVFGGEHSAHYYFRDFFYADSGMLAALHLLAVLAETGVAASELSAMYTPHYASGEINSTLTDVDAAMDRLRAAFGPDVATGHTRVDELDGLSFSHWQELPRWQFNVRPSNTEPLLRLNVEAEDEDVMEKIRDNVLKIIRREST